MRFLPVLALATAFLALGAAAAGATPSAAPAAGGPCTQHDLGATITTAGGAAITCVGRGSTLVWTAAQGGSGNQGGAGEPAPGQPCRAADLGHQARRSNGSVVVCAKSGTRFLWTASKAASGSSGSAAKGNPNVKPVLTRLPVDLAPWDGSAARAGSVVFTQESKDNELHDDSGHGAIWPSGKTFTSHPPEPSLTFRYLDPNATIVSALEGTVLFVRQQPESCDVEINIAPKGAGSGDGIWVVTYDHVRQPQVKIGQAVTPGMALGKPGPEKSGCTGPYRLELQVNKPTGGLAVCPLSVFSPAAATAAKSALTRLMTDWNTFIGAEMHGAADLAGAGCLAAETKA